MRPRRSRFPETRRGPIHINAPVRGNPFVASPSGLLRETPEISRTSRDDGDGDGTTRGETERRRHAGVGLRTGGVVARFRTAFDASRRANQRRFNNVNAFRSQRRGRV